MDIELLAGALDLAADAILVEVVSFGALDAGVATPDSAAEVVIKLHEKCRVAELLLGELHLLSRGLGCQKQDREEEEVLCHLKIYNRRPNIATNIIGDKVKSADS